MSSNSFFEGKRIAIVGASSGLGASLAFALAERGSHLILMARRADKLSIVKKRCETLRAEVQIECLCADATQAKDCETLGKLAEAGGGLDCLIYCAGASMWTRFDAIEDLSIFEKLIAVNYLGLVHCTHSTLPQLKAKRGSLVVISSIQGRLGAPLHTGYAAAKHAVEGFLRALRTELGQSVRIMTVLPQWIRGTELRGHAFGASGKPLGQSSRAHKKRALKPEDCAKRILKGIETGKRELYLPSYLKLLVLLQELWLSASQGIVTRATRKQDEQKDSSNQTP